MSELFPDGKRPSFPTDGGTRPSVYQAFPAEAETPKSVHAAHPSDAIYQSLNTDPDPFFDQADDFSAPTRANKVAGRSKQAQEREMQLWAESIRDPDSYSSQQALEKLTSCYRPMIEDLAWQVYNSHASRGPGGGPEVGDYIAEGYAEMLNSFSKFDPYHRNKLGHKVLLSTYVYHNVKCAMRASSRAQDTIRCTNQKQALVRFLSGGYDDDPQRKAHYQAKFGVLTDDDFAALAAKNASLLAFHESLDQTPIVWGSEGHSRHEMLRDSALPTEDQIINRLMIDQVMVGLSDLQQDIFRLHRGERYTRPEVAEMLGMPLSEVKRQVERIDSHLLQFRSIYARAERRIGQAA